MISNRKSLLAAAALAVALAAPTPAFGSPVPTAAAAVPALLPDLVLEGPQYKSSPGWDGLQVSYTVRNVGGKDTAKATSLRALCFTDYGGPRCLVAGSGWSLGSTAMTGTFDVPVPPLHKGESLTLAVFGVSNRGNDAYKVSGIVSLDPDNLVPESNETNNRSTFSHSREAVTVPKNSVGVPAGTPAPTPTHAYGTGASVGAPVGGTNVSLIKPTPTPIPLLTLSVDPSYTPDKQIFLIARNNTTSPFGGGTTHFDCQTPPGGYCHVVGELPFAVPPLAPGQWQTLGTFMVSQPEGPHTLTITTVGVASKPLVFVYP